MSKVLVLPDHVASQIAAGEVVERPSSVVKELVENSVDAGASQIEISISSGCRDIRVADNGTGMSKEDAVLAFHRHATSKLSSVNDLWSLNTMGFRGEALPSIASVSRITCFTRLKELETGIKVEAQDGKVSAVETGCAPGTVLEVVDLFYNVPARLKFLRTPQTEFAHILDTVQALAVASPEIAFSLINDGEVIIRTAGSGKLSQALVETKFFTGQEELLPVEHNNELQGVRITGYVARPKHFRGDRKGIISIVNKRPVRCPLTLKALDNAFADMIPRGRFPLAAVFVSVDPAAVDVNVHPTKKEIKYTKGNDIFLSIQRGLKEAVRSIPAADYGIDVNDNVIRDTQFGTLTVSEPTTRFQYSSNQLNLDDKLSYIPPAARTATMFAPSQPIYLAPTLPADWRIVGYLHNTYILIETSEGLEIIEQHIAHERTLYERLLAAKAENKPEAVQQLAIPLPLDLSSEQSAWLTENITLLNSLGFEFKFDGTQVACTQLPSALSESNRSQVVQAIIEGLLIGEIDQPGLDPRLEAVKSIACQSAIKNGMPLGHSDIVELLAAWNQTPRNDTCPHGRPVRLKFSTDKLFQLFHPK